MSGPGRKRRLRATLLGMTWIAVVAATAGCSKGPAPGEVEETARATEEVPAAVLDGARAVAGRIGAGGCEAWFWDREDEDWECSFTGLSRKAELDILPDGSFSELELVHDLAEVEQVLEDEATFIRERCRDEPDVVIELSLRKEEHLDDIPDLAEAWKLDGIVLEFQCPNGVDYEIDARHKGVMKQLDDRSDVPPGGE